MISDRVEGSIGMNFLLILYMLMHGTCTLMATLLLIGRIISLEVPLGMCLKGGKMEEFQRLMNRCNCHSPHSTSPNCSKASPKEASLWKIWCHSQVAN